MTYSKTNENQNLGFNDIIMTKQNLIEIGGKQTTSDGFLRPIVIEMKSILKPL